MRAWLQRLLSRPSRTPSRYRQLIAPLPIPTAEQTESFAAFLAGAHSWYKHLPYDPPGVSFVVFLDPNAGRQFVLTADGTAKYSDCVDERDRFHYTWMTTAKYLTKFGHWHYYNTLADRGGIAQVTAGDGTSIAVSPEVVAAGTVYLTACVHESFGHISAFRLREKQSERQAEAEHARQSAELRVALHRVRSLLTRSK